MIMVFCHIIYRQTHEWFLIQWIKEVFLSNGTLLRKIVLTKINNLLSNFDSLSRKFLIPDLIHLWKKRDRYDSEFHNCGEIMGAKRFAWAVHTLLLDDFALSARCGNNKQHEKYPPSLPEEKAFQDRSNSQTQHKIDLIISNNHNKHNNPVS